MPSSVELVNSNVLVHGVETSKVIDGLQRAGLPDRDILDVLGWLVVGASGAQPPPAFHFRTDVPETMAACAIGYSRAFQHVDWIDGESRVQAGTTSEEPGFNARFRGIEQEFDAVAGQLSRLGGCVADLRQQLFGVVRELESKITALQNEIHQIRREDAERPKVVLPGQGYYIPMNPSTPWPPDLFGGRGPISPGGAPIGPGGGPLGPGGVPPIVGPSGPVGGGVIDPTPPWVLDASSLPGDLTNLYVRMRSDAAFVDELKSGAGRDRLIRRYGNILIRSRGAVDVKLGSMLRAMPAASDPRDLDELVDEIGSAAEEALAARVRPHTKAALLEESAAKRSGAALLNSSVDTILATAPATKTALRKAGFDKITNLVNAPISRVLSDVKAGTAGGVIDEADVVEAAIAARIAGLARNRSG